MSNNIIYISYDSMQESLGKSQVLSYLNLISEKNIFIDLISFEKKMKSNFKISNHKIKWHKLKYHKRYKIISAFYDILCGYYTVFKIKNSKNVSLIHARSYISCIVALISHFTFKIPYVFDIRGLWIDEKIESGSWAGIHFIPIIYIFRKIEKSLYINARAIVCLTESSKIYISDKYSINITKFEVIPTCVDYTRFFFDNEKRIKKRNNLGISNNEFLITFSGSIGGYYRLDYILDFFDELSKFVNARLLLLTHTNKEYLISEITSRNLNEKVLIHSCEFEDVVDFLNASDAGLIIYEKSISSIARSSTKLAEYWACSLPVFAPSDVGDVNYLFNLNGQSHLLLLNYERKTFKQVFNNFFNTKKNYDINLDVRTIFDLKTGVDKYLEIYKKINLIN